MIYILVLNYDVFKYVFISWEWGIVFVEVMLFFVGCEVWKWGKRIFFRRRDCKMGIMMEDLERWVFLEFEMDS